MDLNWKRNVKRNKRYKNPTKIQRNMKKNERYKNPTKSMYYKSLQCRRNP